MTRRTRLLAQAGFPGDQYMVDVNVKRGDFYAVAGSQLENFLIDGDNIANYLLRWRGVKNSSLRNIGNMRPTGLASSLAVKFDTAQGALNNQTAAAGTATTITFQAGAACPRDGWFVGATISLIGGAGAGQSRVITGYNGATKVATVSPAWDAAPNATTVFAVTGEVLHGNGALQFNTVENIWVWLGNTGNACGMEWDGDGVHDANQSRYDRVQVVHANGPGYRFRNGDTDWFNGIVSYAFGNGYGAEFYGSDTPGYDGYCRQNFLDNCLFGGASIGGRTGTLQGGAGLTAIMDAGASAIDGYYIGKFLSITGGTGAGQVRKVSAYTGASKVALVSEAWGTPPDATSTFSINGGGGAVLFKGAYRTSRWHSFGAYETQGNGSGMVFMEAGGAYSLQGEREAIFGDVAGYNMMFEAGNDFTAGTLHRIRFRQRLGGGDLADMIELRHLAQGTPGAETGALLVMVRDAAGNMAERVRITSAGLQIGGAAAQTITGVRTGVLAHAGATIAAGASVNVDITVTGVAPGDTAIVNPPGNFAPGLVIDAVYVTAADTVRARVTNRSGASVTLVAGSWRATSFKF